jgi:hypothetical protein
MLKVKNEAEAPWGGVGTGTFHTRRSQKPCHSAVEMPRPGKGRAHLRDALGTQGASLELLLGARHRAGYCALPAPIGPTEDMKQGSTTLHADIFMVFCCRSPAIHELGLGHPVPQSGRGGRAGPLSVAAPLAHRSGRHVPYGPADTGSCSPL